MVRHILHMIEVGGEEFPAIGTDFDGFDGMDHEDIPDCSCMDRLWDGLHRAGISDDQIDRIRYGNALRVIRELAD